ncbi:MAG: hypothetical protein EA380_10650 [Phycisphaeraceae bacterium]|nr:MAG: hypothetical protein EA380_10650 [Phycisphaeraceae bacterium]
MENPQPSIPHSVCRWDGFNLTPVPGTESIGLADAMIVHDDGQGDGTTIFIGGRTGVWKKSGDQWINIGQVAGAPNTTIRINAFAIHDDGSGPALYASGSFTSIDGIDAMKLAKWDGIEWLPVHSETEDFPTILVLSSFQAPGETQPHLYAGSSLFPDSLVPLFQRWDGSSWEDLTPQLAEQLNISSHIIEMVVFDDDNTGPRLYVAGRFQISNHAFCGGIARWDGASATPVGHGLNNIVHAITEFDSKPIVAGDFTRAGTVELNHIAQWDGQAWQPLGSGVSRDPVARIYATAVHDDGSGPALYAGGLFITAGGVPANNIARWDGNQWTPVGSGTNGLVYALQVYDDGSGSALYAGGSFTTAGGQTVNNIARWDGASWSPIGPGFDGTVFALCVYQGMLVAGGNFTYAGTERRNKIAIWDPSTGTWDRMRKGFDSSVRALAATQGSPTEPSLLYAAGYFAGSFEQLFSPAVAVWNGNVWSAPAANALRTADQHGNVTPPFATSIHVIEDPTGGAPTIYFGGRFLTPEPNPTQGVATLRNGQWINEGLDFSDMFNGIGAATTATRASAFHSFSENSLVGPAFAIAGNFIKVPGGDSFVSIWNLNTDITPAPCPGDINGDGIVDLDDFIILAGNFGSGPGATPQQGDLNGDGFVDLDDFIILAGNFGNNCN